jgi:hypothetical protein
VVAVRAAEVTRNKQQAWLSQTFYQSGDALEHRPICFKPQKRRLATKRHNKAQMKRVKALQVY